MIPHATLVFQIAPVELFHFFFFFLPFFFFTFKALITRLDPSLFACLLLILDQLHVVCTASGYHYSYNVNGVILNGKQRIGKW